MTSVEPEIEKTEIARPRERVFLPLTRRERIQGALWTLVRMTLFRLSPEHFNAWRSLLLRMFGATVDRNVSIHRSCRIEFPWNLRIGSDVVIGHGCIISCIGEIRIGDRTHISQYAHIVSGTHDYESRAMPILRTPISIGHDVWIAADAFVGPGVNLGDGSLLAARSSAFRDLPAGMVCVGEPARPIHAREHGEPVTART